MPGRRSTDIFVPVNSIGTSTPRHVVTPEMREAYHNTLLEKEKIIEEIKLVKEELRQGGIDAENLHQREQMVVRGLPTEYLGKYNPHKVHPGTAHSPARRSTPVAGPSPRPMPPPMPDKPKTTLDIQTAPSPPPPSSPPPPLCPASAHPPPKQVQYEDGQVQPHTSHEPKVIILDNETTQTEPISHNAVIPENLRFSETYKPKPASDVPPTPPTPASSEQPQHIVYSPAKEVEEYIEYSDTSLAIQRDLHMEIAAMHAAIQKRLMLGGAFITLLIFLLIFY